MLDKYDVFQYAGRVVGMERNTSPVKYGSDRIRSTNKGIRQHAYSPGTAARQISYRVNYLTE